LYEKLPFYDILLCFQSYSAKVQLAIIFQKKGIIMNLKRLFGFLLTLGGAAGIIYGAWLFAWGGMHQGAWISAGVWFIVGLIFFTAGIGLVKRTKDAEK
jgi:hypothetical protein